MTHRLGLVAFLVCTALPAPAAEAGRILCVAIDGKAGAAGTAQRPLASLADAAAKAAPGDVIRLGPGTYREGQTIRLQAKGTEANPIRVEAVGPERPVLDFAAQTEGRKNAGVEVNGDWWQIVGLEVAHAGGFGIRVTGAHNVLDHCVVRENQLTGLQIDAGRSFTLVTGCDSFRNFDPQTQGEDADGFAVKHGAGPGNVFRHCRAYQNADDGWDLWMARHPVVIEDSVAFRNGYNVFGAERFQGDGNGFKLGGNYVDVAHVVRRNVAIENPLSGFEQNHNLGPLTLEDNVAIRCGRGFSLPEKARGGRIVLRNNTSFGSQSVLEPSLLSERNQWVPDIAAGPLGPPPRPGHREVPGAGPVPTDQVPPIYTPAPSVLAPIPEPLKEPATQSR
jgi:hypothetical protein